MKNFSLLSLIALAVTANAHSIFQKMSVNGADQGFLVGVRAPDSDYPVQDVTSGSIACNTGMHQPVSTAVITVQAGASLAAGWGHVLGGAQFSGDPDNPIASSHKGPLIYYLAKVGNAANAGASGLQWFKIAQDTIDGNGVWGVDRMIANGGWSKFTLPSCIAPGDYLLRAELIALHSAENQGGAQFYMSCANLRVTGSGKFTGSGFLSFPGAYHATDPGILVNIYDNAGHPNNGGRPYTAPGGAVQQCPSGGGGGQPQPTSTKPSSTAQPTSTSGSGSGGAALYGQCGGIGFTGPTTCSQGTCKVSNAYYSQCLP